MAHKFDIPMCKTCESREHSVFCKLNHLELEDVDYSKTTNLYKRGNIIFYEGNRPSGLFCINKGKVKIYKMGEDGKEQIVRFAKAGDVIGYRALISGETYAASAEPLEDSTVCAVPETTFFNVLRSNSKLAASFMQILTHDLKSAEETMVKLAQKSVRERLAEALLILRETYGEDPDGGHIDVTLTREELANFVGTATESVIRLLSDFNKDGMITLKGRKIIISDLNALIKAANVYD